MDLESSLFAEGLKFKKKKKKKGLSSVNYRPP